MAWRQERQYRTGRKEVVSKTGLELKTVDLRGDIT